MRIIQQESTIYHYFSSRQYSTGASFAIAGVVVSAYEDNSDTQITAGVSVAVADTVTGLYRVTVVATAANGFDAGSHYTLVITTGTVDSVSVTGSVVGEFVIESDSSAATRLLNEYVYPTHILGTQTGVSDGSKINLSAQVDAQTPANSLRGSVWLVRRGADGQMAEVVVTQNDAGGLCSIRQLGTLDDLGWTPLVTADFAWRVNTLDQRTAEGVIIGKASGTPTTTASNSDLSGIANDEIIGRTITWISGTADTQQARITDYVSTSGVLAFTQVTTAPASGDLFKIT